MCIRERSAMANNPNKQTITSTEFGRSVGAYIEKSAKTPVFITKHNRPARVLLDIDEYERLKKRDRQEKLFVSELSDEDFALIEGAEYGKLPPETAK